MIEIIPAIDLIDGKCVRLSQGDYSQKTIYNENPLEVAKQFEALGIKRLHLVDLDGAKAGKIQNLSVLEQIAGNTSLLIDFGGGVQSPSDFHSILEAGAAYVTIGSLAVKQAALFHQLIQMFGADKILLGVDVKDYQIVVSAWTETTEIHIFDFLEAKMKQGIHTVFSTDISKDGMLTGPSLDLYTEIHQRFPELKLIASGGVSKIEDVYALEKVCSGVIIGKAIYEGKINLQELMNFK